MLNHKTQHCFFNNLIGRFYKNQLILGVKALNLDFILDVVEFPTSIEGFKKTPKASKIKIPFTQLAKDLQPKNQLELVQSDIKNLFLEIGKARHFINGDCNSISYATSLFQHINDEEMHQIEVLNYALKFLSIIKDINLHNVTEKTYIDLKPLRYAFSLDTFLSATADLDQPFDNHEALSGHIVINWEKWVKANNITSESSYDAVLLNADKLILVRVGNNSIRITINHSVSVQITDLDTTDGIIYASVCDLELIQSVFHTFFKGFPCRITAYADMNIHYEESKYKTWLSPQSLKKFQCIRSHGLEKYLRKKLEAEGALSGSVNLAKTLMNNSYTEQTLSLFSDAWGLSYVNYFENKIRHAFYLVLQSLELDGISREQLQFINSITKGAVENIINEMFNNTGSPLAVVPSLSQGLISICDEYNAKKLILSSELLHAIKNFSEQHAVSPLIVIERDSSMYLLYEPLVLDNRLNDYEWYSEAVYTNNSFMIEATDLHKSDIADLLKSVEVQHVFKPNILSWTSEKIFDSPEEKNRAFDLCLTPEDIENHIDVLRSKNKIPGYFKKIITSLNGANTVSTEDDKYGIFLIESICKNTKGFAYQGSLISINQGNQLDIDQRTSKTLNSELLSKNYLTFKRLIKLSNSLTKVGI